MYKKKALFIWVPTNIKSGVFEELVSHIIIMTTTSNYIKSETFELCQIFRTRLR